MREKASVAALVLLLICLSGAASAAPFKVMPSWLGTPHDMVFRITTRGEQTWAVGSDFTMGDCAAAPALFYSDWVHPIGDRFPSVCAYRARLLARPSIARTVDEARPYRKLFPPGAPDRD